MFYRSFTSFVHPPPLIFNPGYAYAGTPTKKGRTGRKCRKCASGTCNGQNLSLKYMLALMNLIEILALSGAQS